MTRGRRRAEPAPPRWRRLLSLEPALVRGAVGSVVTVGLVWGIDLSELGERVATTADVVLGTLLPLLAAWWIRGAVVPSAKVAAPDDDTAPPPPADAP
jgi:hypothetical protein